MGQPVVLQLQELASDSKHDVVDLLRKALLVATKLNLSDFRTWLMNELNGYEDAEYLPDYRIINGDLRAQNPFHGLIPFIIQDAQIANLVRRIHVAESIASLVHLIDSSRTGAITFGFGPEQEAALMRMLGDFAPLRPLRVVGANQLSSIIQAVRTKVLEWALALEKEGIVGDGLTFSDKEKSIAKGNPSIRIENFQGVLGDVHGGSVTQTNTLTIKAGNFSSLAKYLDQQGVAKDDVKELEKAIQADSEPKDAKKLGPKVSMWIGRMVAKAADGSWEISVATAGTLLAAAIAKFYGL